MLSISLPSLNRRQPLSLAPYRQGNDSLSQTRDNVVPKLGVGVQGNRAVICWRCSARKSGKSGNGRKRGGAGCGVSIDKGNKLGIAPRSDHYRAIRLAMHNPPQAPTVLTLLKSICMQGRRLARQAGSQMKRPDRQAGKQSARHVGATRARHLPFTEVLGAYR